MPELSSVLKIAIPVVVGAVALLIIVLVSTSLKKLESFEMGIKYDVVARKLSEETFFEGLHLGPVGYRFIKFPSVYRTIEFDDLTCLNKDGVEIKLDVSYQFIAVKSSLKRIILQFKDAKNFEKVLRYAGQSAIQEVCAQFTTEAFQSERGSFQARVKEAIKQRYKSLNARITDLQARDIRRPSEYESAIRKKEEARQAIEVAQNEMPRRVTEAQTLLLKAQKQANITLEKAQSDARILHKRSLMEAEGLKQRYERQTVALRTLASDTGFGPEQLVTYSSYRVIGSSKNPVYVAMRAP